MRTNRVYKRSDIEKIERTIAIERAAETIAAMAIGAGFLAVILTLVGVL